MTKPTSVYFYRKTDCHLCEEMARELADFRAENKFQVIERDIEDDPKWFAKYREYVPVLVIGSREICYYFFDGDELKSALQDDESCDEKNQT